MDREAKRGMAVVFIPGLLFVALLIGVLSRFSPTQPFEPATFYGCYAANGLNLELGANFIRLPGSDGPLPAHVERDKHGPLVVVERPVRYRRNAAGGLDLASYRGTGTFFRLQDGLRPTIELVIEGELPWPRLAKVSCP